MQANSPYTAYSRNSVEVESPQKLVLMLYEGILRFTFRAQKAIDDGDVEQRVIFLNKVTAIFFELLNSLDMSQGDVAYYLSGLYERQIQVIMQANINNDKTALDEVIKVTRGLIDAWNEVTQGTPNGDDSKSMA